MNKKILITWISRWIWKWIYDNLKNNHISFWISRSIVDEKNCYSLDLTKSEQINNFIKIINNQEDILVWNIIFDVLVLNAWVWYYWKFENNSIENYEEIIDLNLTSNIKLLYKLKNNISKKTKIIFIWSIASKKFMNNWAVYIASKFWLRWFAWALKSEWKKVNIINPKIVETDFHKWKIEIDSNIPKTSLNDIVKTVQNIINWDEKRFEIDL